MRTALILLVRMCVNARKGLSEVGSIADLVQVSSMLRTKKAPMNSQKIFTTPTRPTIETGATGFQYSFDTCTRIRLCQTFLSEHRCKRLGKAA